MRFEINTIIKTLTKLLTRKSILGCHAAVRQICQSADNLRCLCRAKAISALHSLGKGAFLAFHALGKGVDTALGGFESGVESMISLVRSYKKSLISLASLCALFLVLLSASSSSHTFYEYSIGGQVLGVVKDEKMVSRAVESSSNVNRTDSPDDSKVIIPVKNGASVVLDKNEDIIVEKKMVTNTVDLHIDSGEDIIEKITTLEDVNVIAYTFSVDDRTFGPFESSGDSLAVTDRVREYWLGGADPEQYKEIGFSNVIAYSVVTVPKDEIVSPDDAYDEIMKDVIGIKKYKVKDGDTVFDIAMDKGLTVDKIEELNPDMDLEVLHTGDKLLLEEITPILSVRTVEEIQYDDTYKANPVYNDSDKLYEGEEIVTSEGKSGRRHVTADRIRINGKISEEQVTSTEILKESVPDQVMRGTKELPPLIGKGYFIMPANAVITSGFKYRWGRHHNGIDIGIRYGSVSAADGGEVTFAGSNGDSRGNYIIINHGGGRETLYAHLSEIKVKVGEKVYQGQRIAISGNSGGTTGPHLHFEVRINGVPKNPMDYL
jgi:murein DD-endopeptidase MepM/ murein hydrolase activator NlpD